MLEINISPMNPLCEVMEAMAAQNYPLVKMSVEDAQSLMSLADGDYEFFFDANDLAETWNQVLDDNKADMVKAYEVWKGAELVRVDFTLPALVKEDESIVPIVVCNGQVSESVPEKASVLVPAYFSIDKDINTFKAFVTKLEALNLGHDAYNWGLRRYLRAIA